MITKLGSLFDGSGGFPLAGALCGIEPIWASEVEPYPIAVTKSRLPKMKHLGDISKINGAEIEPVDIITFGSPCQDLSVAGKRAGLKHQDHGDGETTRSGLFMEAVRIIKEMRVKTNGKYPRFALWENVPGAFSSNKGEDFRVVLEEIIKIAEPNAVMPKVPQKGWAYADCYCGNGWSLAYRVLDAQYWGVPQRRRRIYLVADFGGGCAREILFKREGLRGYFTEGRTPWQRITTDVEGGIGADDRERAYGVVTKGNGDAFVSSERHTSLSTGGGQAGQGYPCVAYGISSYESNAMKSNNPNSGIYETNTSRTLDGNGGNPACNQGGIAIIESTAIIDNIGGQAEYAKASDVNGTLRAGTQGAIAYVLENYPNDSRVKVDKSGKVQALTGRMGTGGGNVPMVLEVKTIFTHPQNDTWTFENKNKVQTLSASMGMGDGNTPLVMEQTPFCKSRRAKNPDDYTTWKDGMVANTLNTFDQGEVRANELVVETVSLEGNGQRPSHRGDGYSVSDKSYTLNATEVHGIVYAVDQGGGKSQANVSEDMSPTLTCTHGGEPAVAYPTLTASKASFFTKTDENIASTLVATDYKDPQLVAYNFDSETSREVSVVEKPIAIDRAFFNQGQNALYEPQVKEDGTTPTLLAKGPSAVCHQIPPKPVYIVRRLTPTECARLQGFPDFWGDIDNKDDLADEEYEFWLEVRNTHATINGKKIKDYTKAQMLTWYKKLHTDSAEYKMWGNGIALPTALYVMQGIKEVSNESYKD